MNTLYGISEPRGAMSIEDAIEIHGLDILEEWLAELKKSWGSGVAHGDIFTRQHTYHDLQWNDGRTTFVTPKRLGFLRESDADHVFSPHLRTYITEIEQNVILGLQEQRLYFSPEEIVSVFLEIFQPFAKDSANKKMFCSGEYPYTQYPYTPYTLDQLHLRIEEILERRFIDRVISSATIDDIAYVATGEQAQEWLDKNYSRTIIEVGTFPFPIHPPTSIEKRDDVQDD